MSVRREKLQILGYHALLVGLAVLKTATRPTASLMYGAYDLREHDRLVAEYARLQKRGLVKERDDPGRGAALWELTEAGKLALDGGRDIESRWNRGWDGSWCLFTYDAPTDGFALRQRLRRWLQQNGFGLLQQSVWIAPDAPSELDALLGRLGLDPCDGIAFRSRLRDDRDPAAIVSRAWSFAAIGRAQDAYMAFAETTAKKVARSRTPAGTLAASVAQDRDLWTAAFARDPLLPRELWPDDYRGPAAIAARHRLIAAATE